MPEAWHETVNQVAVAGSRLSLPEHEDRRSCQSAAQTARVTRTVVVGELPAALREWLRSRQELGQDLFDEVWQGEYHVAPAAHRRHGDLDDQLAALLSPPARARGLWPSGPTNIGEPADYRVPDRAYFSRREPATFEPTAEIIVEIVSPGDETYAKLGFYFGRGVRELLIVDSDCSVVEWYGRGEDGFIRSGRSRLLEFTEAAPAEQLDWPPAD
jgi:Uma2 family endonuclease